MESYATIKRLPRAAGYHGNQGPKKGCIFDLLTWGPMGNPKKFDKRFNYEQIYR